MRYRRHGFIFVLIIFLAGAKSEPVLIYQDSLHREPLKAIALDSPLRAFAHEMGLVFSQKEFRKAHVGFIVTSAKSQEVLAERDADILLNPASNIKLITTLAALSILRPEYRFKTEYYMDNGNLYVKGYGDPTIVSEGLQRVAHELKLRGVTQITGRVVLDTSYFDNNNEPKGFEKFRNSLKTYAAPIGALSFNHNMVQIVARPTQKGQPAFWSVEPASDYFQTEGKIETGTRSKRPSFRLIDDGKSMRVVASGKIGMNAGFIQMRRRIFNPDQHFAGALIHYLTQEGIGLSSNSFTIDLVPAHAKLLYVDRSAPLTQIIAETNKHSSNFMAEMLVKAIAAKTATPASFANGLDTIREFLEKSVGFKPGSYSLINGSGLGDGNRLSARHFAKLLAYGSHNFEIASEFIGSLGVAGSQGTLSKRMRDSDANGRLRAKTGTLNNVSALSGYVATKNNDTLIFSILVEGHMVPAYRIWRLQDRIGDSLAQVRILSPEGDWVTGGHQEENDGLDTDMDEEDDEATGG